MEEDRKPDFSGWATKNNMRCSDGRTIRDGAFKHMDKAVVPLFWQHGHDSVSNLLGHALLESRAFGTYAYGFFNESPSAKEAREAVRHGDVKSLSIYATKLKQRGGDVLHGDIKEVSLVMAGANPGAFIENVSIAHGDDFNVLDTEAIIMTGIEFGHQESTEGDTIMAKEDKQDKKAQDEVDHTLSHATATDETRTLKEIFEEDFSEEQKNLVYYLLGNADKAGDDSDVEHTEIMDGAEILQHIDDRIAEGFNAMNTSFNAFEKNGGESGPTSKLSTLSHSETQELFADAKRRGSFKEALEHADYGITDIDFLFPEAKTVDGESPQMWSRRMEWVSGVLSAVKKVPFSRIKTVVADITADEARARGYAKGTMKKDEVIKLLQRKTTPATIYKKQKLDRDDLLDITSFDVVAWLKAEIRMMLEEEIARAILIGDGRDANDPDHISDPEGANSGEGIRSILKDNEFYAHKVEIATNVTPRDQIKEIQRSRLNYRGTGSPVLYVDENLLTEWMLLDDKMGRPLYETEAALASKLRVSRIEPLQIFNQVPTLVAILVNLSDYTVGTNKGGEISQFEDFDIDFNQYKYLMETRLAGALTMPKSAIVYTRAAGTAATPQAPSFDGATNTITVPTVAGIVYLVDSDPVTGAVVIDEDTEVVATADDGYYIPVGTTTRWSFTYTAG